MPLFRPPGGSTPAAGTMTIASAAERATVTQTIPGASPFTFTCPAGQVVQFAVSGGASVSTSINSTSGGNLVFVGGSVATPIISPGETITISWTTAPSAIRSRILFKVA